MIRKLRLWLTLLCTVLTGAVLVSLVAALCVVGGREYRALGASMFQGCVSQITGKLLSDREIQNNWLADLEAENRLVIRIKDRNVPLFFSGGWSPSTARGDLLARADEALALLNTAEPAPDDAFPTQQTAFTVQGEQGDAYWGALVRIAVPGGSYELTVLGDQTKVEAQLRRQRTLYSLAACGGNLLLAGVSWFLSGAAVRPVRRSMIRQNTFIAAASHELRSPLAAVGTCAAAILIDREATDVYVRHITRECARLGRLVDDLLLLASTGVPSWTIRREILQLDTLLIELTEQMTPFARENGHALRLDLPDDRELPSVMGDDARIRQAVGNLISNAACHAGGSDPIVVRGVQGTRGVCIEVVDHGVGIAPECRDRAFERFYRADTARSDKEHFGLGLSIAREITRLHGGRLELTQTPFGGCTFRLFLPVCRAKTSRK